MSEESITRVTWRATFLFRPKVGDIVIPDITPRGQILSTGVLVKPDQIEELKPKFWMSYTPGGWVGHSKGPLSVEGIEIESET